MIALVTFSVAIPWPPEGLKQPPNHSSSTGQMIKTVTCHPYIAKGSIQGRKRRTPWMMSYTEFPPTRKILFNDNDLKRHKIAGALFPFAQNHDALVGEWLEHILA